MANRKKSPSKRPKEKTPRASKPKAKSATDKQQPDTKIERFRQNMRCELSSDELNDKAKQVAHKLSEKALRVEAAKSATAHLKAEIKQIDAEISRLSQEINDGATFREVDCERHFKYRVGSVVEYRMDTNTQTFERAMNASERQLELPKPKAAAAKTEPNSRHPDDLPESKPTAAEEQESDELDDEPTAGDTVEAPEENGDVPA